VLQAKYKEELHALWELVARRYVSLDTMMKTRWRRQAMPRLNSTDKTVLTLMLESLRQESKTFLEMRSRSDRHRVAGHLVSAVPVERIKTLITIGT